MKIKFITLMGFSLFGSFLNYYAQQYSGSLEFEGGTRDYIVFLPQNYQSNMPVIINLHARNRTAQQQMDGTRMNDVADTAGFIVVYPSAISSMFNSTIEDHPDFPTPDVNDVGFIDVLIDTLHKHYSIDLERIYVCGMSNGGFMSYRLACELSYRVAAIASVAGVLTSSNADNCNSQRTIPVLQIHGTDDGSVSINGDTTWFSADQTLSFWTDFNGCVLADTVLLPDIDTTDGCTVEKISYYNCYDESKVIFYKVINGGHTWPGSPVKAFFSDNANMDINANVEIWNFFKNYRNPLINAAYGKSLELNSNYIHPNGDTLIINAHLYNPKNHPVTVKAKINGDEHTVLDSIELYDDGRHGDRIASDNIWGGIWLSGLKEDMYEVELYTNDLIYSTVILSLFKGYFTTSGPVAYESMEITFGNENPSPSERIKFSLTLKNTGTTDTIHNVSVNRISTDNPCILNTTLGNPDFGDIPPGSSLSSSRDFALTFTDSCLPGAYEFKLEITSDDIVYWEDTFTITVAEPTGVDDDLTDLPTEFALKQNYPNPFNPSTTIKYSLPVISWQSSVGSQKQKKSQSTNHPIYPGEVKRSRINQSNGGLVSLKIYDVLGKEVATLVNEQQRPGRYEVKWDAAGQASGVYFYKLSSGQFFETKKMILLR